jgi:1-acyl-sn-glycerol-3-phosphate acyltransferase
MHGFLRKVLYYVVLKPVIFLGFGVWVRGRENFPVDGPAIFCVNHNSHLDLMVSLAICGPVHRKIRPVAAADYFYANPFLRFISNHFLRIIPIDRTQNPLQAFLDGCSRELDAGNVVLIFPEGTRGEPEQVQELKGGVACLAQSYPDIPVIPVFLYGTGRTLPRGAWLPVPFRIDAFVGKPIEWKGNREGFMAEIMEFFENSGQQVYRPISTPK